MSRATPEATGCRQQATTCFVLPWWLPGQQQTKQRQKKGPTLLAILMAVAVRRYDTVHSAQIGGSGLHYKPLDTTIGQVLYPIT